MTTLEEFLALPDVTNETTVVNLKRIGDIVVKPMTHKQFSSYQARAKVKTAKGLDFDTGKLNLLVATGQIVQPDISNADFLAKAGCNTASEFLEKKLKAGEIAELAAKITEISGFDVDMNEKIDEAKN